MGPITERAEFPGHDGSTLAARLDRPVGAARAFALFAHCFTCGKDIAAATRIARALAEHGVAVLRFDFTGLGHSEGEFANADFTSNVEDLVAAAGWLREQHAAPALLIGHSLGGAAVLAAAGDIPEVRAVVTIGAPSDPGHVERLFASDVDAIERDGRAEVQIAGRPFTVTRGFIDDVRAQRLSDRIGSMRKALLVMHGTFDDIVGLDNAAAIFEAAKHPKSFVSLDSADHLLKREADARYAASVIAAWADRYVPELSASDRERPDAQVRVDETGEGRYTQAIAAGRHRLVADEPARVGGDDRGPAPYDFLLAALGSCTAMTLRMYAERKELPLDRVVVDLDHDKVDGPEGKKVDRIRRVVTIRGDALTAAQRKRLLEIADRCPVHRTLESRVRIETTGL